MKETSPAEHQVMTGRSNTDKTGFSIFTEISTIIETEITPVILFKPGVSKRLWLVPPSNQTKMFLRAAAHNM